MPIYDVRFVWMFVLFSCIGIIFLKIIISEKDIEDITRWREDMDFMFEWQELYLTSELTCNVLFII